MARKRVSSDDSDVKFDYLSLLNETIDDVSHRLNYDSDPLEEATPMSTGMLILDLLYGGGIRPGWYTHFGAEQSSKTTGTLVIAASALKQNVPFISYFDYEGSSANSIPYIQSIVKTAGLNQSVGQIFGTKDPDTGKWITPPMIRFHAESIGERFFDFLGAVLRELPDKKKINGQWWLVYDEANKKAKAKVSEFADPTMAKKYGKGLWVPAENGELQAIFIVDSYPAMNPASNDEDETDNSIALQARMFSKQLPRVKGRLMQKMVAVIGTNQLRAVPMAMFGPKEAEPGGQALKFNCFGENTLLHTPYGMLTAKEYAVYSKHPSMQSILHMEKINGWKCVGFSKTIKAVTDFGYYIEGKPGHKVLIAECGEKQYPIIKWSTLQNLCNKSISKGCTGTYIAVSCNQVDKPTEYQHIDYKYVGTKNATVQTKYDDLHLICDETIGELLGWIISEGYVGSYGVCISNTNQSYLKHIGHLCDVIGLNYTIKQKQVSIKGSVFAQWLKSIGCAVLSMHKAIPLIIRQSPASVQIAFLRGIFAGDGFASSKETSYSSISNTLLDQLQIMLLSFGIIAKKRSYKKNYQEHRMALASDQLQMSIAKLLDTSSPMLLQHQFKTGSLYISGYNSRLLRELIGWKTHNLSENSDNEMSNVLPQLFTNHKRTRRPKLYNWFIQNISSKEKKHWRAHDFYDGWYNDFVDYVSTLKFPHEKAAMIKDCEPIKRLVEATKRYNLYWFKLEDITCGTYQPCYDANMVDTHTIITNGIVSHNSDVRCKFTPRASGQPLWPKNFDKDTGWELEKSVEYEKGIDGYRYIHLKTVKNKLSAPNRIGWLRIWAKDGSGSARGYDPFFDTAYYLYLTGQLVGRGRKSMKLKLNNTDIEPAIDWPTLKLWVLGTNQQKKEICAKLGYKKPFCLRKYCFSQMRRGTGEKLYVEHTQSADVEEQEE